MNTAQQKKFHEAFVEIIRKTSTELPKTWSKPSSRAKSRRPQSRGEYALGIIEKNIGLAKLKSQPLCQDTGSILFYIHYPYKMDAEAIAKVIRKAVTAATKKGYLRQNSVDSLTGKNNGTNVGPGTPTLHLEPWKKDHFDIRLMLKGGGCENVGAQYSLPDTRIGAGRDLVGVKKCILDAVQQAQGKGCGPGILGVTIGGDRATGYLHSKEQFLRKMTDTKLQSGFRRARDRSHTRSQRAGDRPDGLWRKDDAAWNQGERAQPSSGLLLCQRLVHVLGVSAPGCASQRQGRHQEMVLLRGHAMIQLEAPFTEDKIRALKVGDMVEISGVLFTGRDAVHKWLHEGNEPPVSFQGRHYLSLRPGRDERKKGKWVVTAAGPTTSIREEPYQAGIIEKHGFAP